MGELAIFRESCREITQYRSRLGICALFVAILGGYIWWKLWKRKQTKQLGKISAQLEGASKRTDELQKKEKEATAIAKRLKDELGRSEREEKALEKQKKALQVRLHPKD